MSFEPSRQALIGQGARFTGFPKWAMLRTFLGKVKTISGLTYHDAKCYLPNVLLYADHSFRWKDLAFSRMMESWSPKNKWTVFEIYDPVVQRVTMTGPMTGPHNTPFSSYTTGVCCKDAVDAVHLKFLLDDIQTLN